MYFVRSTPGGEYGVVKTPCSYNPCQNGGLCVVISNTAYKCLCNAGWTGDKYLKMLNQNSKTVQII